MVFSLSDTTKLTLFNLDTSLDSQGMKSRVILKKAKNRLKFRFTKIALEFNPYILGRQKRHRSVFKTFICRAKLEDSIRIAIDKVIKGSFKKMHHRIEMHW